jgi:hypothetical protein
LQRTHCCSAAIRSGFSIGQEACDADFDVQRCSHAIAHRHFIGGESQRLFTIITFGTPNQQQNSARLGLPGGGAFKEIFNSSWPKFEQEHTNGSYAVRIQIGDLLNLPYISAVVPERA